MSLIDIEGQGTKKLERPQSEIVETATKHHIRYIRMKKWPFDKYLSNECINHAHVKTLFS